MNNTNRCCSARHLFHTVNFWNVKLHHVLNAVLQGDCGAWAPCAGTHQLQFDYPIVKPFKDDIAPVFLHRGSGKHHK